MEKPNELLGLVPFSRKRGTRAGVKSLTPCVQVIDKSIFKVFYGLRCVNDYIFVSNENFRVAS